MMQYAIILVLHFYLRKNHFEQHGWPEYSKSKNELFGNTVYFS